MTYTQPHSSIHLYHVAPDRAAIDSIIMLRSGVELPTVHRDMPLHTALRHHHMHRQAN